MEWLHGGGEMGAALRAFDWSQTPLGPPAIWPERLRTTVTTCLNSRFPIFIWWGPALINFYNDAYISVLGKRHPGALGRPARELWHDVWGTIGTQVQGVMERGEATWNERVLLTIHRNGYPENAYFTYSHSPVFEDDGRVAGLICVVSEETMQVNAEQRQAFLVRLEDVVRGLSNPREIITAAVHALGAHLRVNRAGYGHVQPDGDTIVLESSYTDGLMPLTGTFPLESFGAENIARQRLGITVIHEDVAAISSNNPPAWAAIETRSFVSVPLIRNGQFRASLYVNQREPRHWAPEDVALIEYVAARIWDASERARSEATLRDREEKYRSLFETIDEGFCVIEMLFDAAGRPWDYRFLEANGAFEKHTGLTGVIGRTIREFVPNHDEYWFQTYGEVARTGVSARVENLAQAMGRFYDVYAFRIGEPQKHQVAVLFNDITERKAAEAERERLLQQIEAEHQRLEQVFSQAPVAIVVLRGPEHIVELANPFYEKLLQGRVLAGRRLSDIVQEPISEVWDAIFRVNATGEPVVRNESYVPYDQDGDGVPEDHWFNLVYHPLRDSGGQVSGIVAVCSEVTAQVMARKHLEQANRELEEFAYVASHDLQEPLRMINIYTQLLLRRHVGAVAEAQEYAAVIQRSVGRLEVLIRDLLAFSRTIHAEEPPVATADLSAALLEAISVLQQRIEASGATIRSSALPTVRGDTSQLAGVFQNLLSNALKYVRQGHAPEIDISAEWRGAQWVISVADHGIGFQPQYAERIFGLFKRLHNEEFPGTGLGLAICRRIIERYGGRIWAEGRPGEGATFFFSLPGAGEEPGLRESGNQAVDPLD